MGSSLYWTVILENDVHHILLLFQPQDDVWKPDVSLKNSYKSFTGLGSSYLNVRVQSDGLIEWYPFQVYL